MVKMFKEAVLEFAQSYVGTKEIGSNDDFQDPKFRRLMDLAGWEKDQAWCAYFAELCWTVPQYYGKSKYLARMFDHFSANAVRTYENFSKDDMFVCDQVPEPGAVMVMERIQNGEPKKIDIWTLGHAGIVKEVKDDYIVTIEGNTNSAGSREGDTVAIKKRKLKFSGVENGLQLLGFIKLKK